jgi:putative hemolysin
MKTLIIFGLAVFLLMVSASGLINPAAAYCMEMGYEYEDGACILPNEESVDSWDFLQGKTSQNYSYCEQEGYELKTINDSEKCLIFLTPDCAVCVLDNGSEVEVTDLMGLSFRETVCGDGTCGLPENYESCPKDCPSGTIDGLCDGKPDGICDADCEETGENDPDCIEGEEDMQENTGTTDDSVSESPDALAILAIMLVAIIIVLTLAILKKRKSSAP